MANEIRVQTSVQIVNDVSVANDSGAAGDYTNYALDVFSGQRSWGGSYTMNQAYSTSDVAYWSNVVVAEASSADGLNDSGWTEASDVTGGTLPATVHVVAVEYVSALGSPGTISVTVDQDPNYYLGSSPASSRNATITVTSLGSSQTMPTCLVSQQIYDNQGWNP